ncbi:uncharacterized protein PG986_010040 [Apiospora aurea]|uniref:Uncharacterized protein n=1 Tax=Apiospora aurea TaxID=335848 RepID=A0ABR1Q9T4_9PEZI
MFTNLLYMSVKHAMIHRDAWRSTTPAELPQVSSFFGVEPEVYPYGMRPLTRMYLGICTRSHVVALLFRYLLPQAIRLVVAPSSCWASTVTGVSPRHPPGLALTVLGTAAEWWLLSIMGTAADVDTMRKIL